VAALQQRMTSLEFSEWLAYAQLEPFGEERGDLRAAIVASVMANRWRGKNERPTTPMDFMPYAKKRQQSPEEIKAELRSILSEVTRGKRRPGKD